MIDAVSIPINPMKHNNKSVFATIRIVDTITFEIVSSASLAFSLNDIFDSFFALLYQKQPYFARDFR